MRSYGQYCPLAKALDVIGDRWSLLIVRELLIRGRCRYTDLRNGVPGVASNLLADRLRDLEREGIVAREDAPPPIATTLFALTERGEALKPVLAALVEWGTPMMGEAGEEDAFCGHWLALPAELYLTDHAPHRPPVAIELRADEEPIVIETIDGAVRARPGSAEAPDLVLSGAPRLVAGLLTGALTLSDARSGGLQCEGDTRILARVRGRDSARVPSPAGTTGA